MVLRGRGRLLSLSLFALVLVLVPMFGCFNSSTFHISKIRHSIYLPHPASRADPLSLHIYIHIYIHIVTFKDFVHPCDMRFRKSAELELAPRPWWMAAWSGRRWMAVEEGVAL